MGDYFTQECLDPRNLNVQILLRRLEDYNRVLKYFDDVEDREDTNDDRRKQVTNLYVKAFLYVDEKRISRIYQTAINKSEDPIELVIEFDEQLNLLPYTTFLAFSVFSCDRSDERPIASTTIPLYNENLEMRQGQYSLFLWPESYPDICFETSTPGLLEDKTFATINADLKKYMKVVKMSDDPIHKTKPNLTTGMHKLDTKSHIVYKSVPFAFLIVELPDCRGHTVYYGVLPKKIAGSSFENKLITSKLGESSQAGKLFESEDTAKFFIPPDYVNTHLIVRDFEHDFRRDEDPILQMFFKATKDEGDPKSFRPETKEIKRLEAILKKPNFANLEPKEESLVWKYRYFLKDNPDALPKVLKSNYYTQPHEFEEVIALMQDWATIGYDDAIYLLSADFTLNNFTLSKGYNPSKEVINSAIRQYAVNILKQVDTAKLDFIFLQLISALRYEKIGNLEKSSLLQFLMEASMHNKNLANLFYWHICVECEAKHPEVRKWYEGIKDSFLTKIKEQSPTLAANIHNHIIFRKHLQELAKDVVSKNKNAETRTADLRKRLQDSNLLQYLEGKSGEAPGSFYILNPNKITDQIVPEKCRVFRSNTSPVLLIYKTRDGGNYGLLYKNGDDLRTDQLVMQMISLMDTLMKSLNLDLQLTVYQILAYGSIDGIMECVANSKTVQDIIDKYNSKLYNYFVELTEKKQLENPDYKPSLRSDIKFGPKMDKEVAAAICRIDPVIMNNYIESLAGYCVISYLLGLGDRHLENLMLDETGKIFHIDFGYAMGEDPKWNPPPFKLTFQMIEAMGGRECEYYHTFENKCVTYFMCIRKQSKLILNLMHLMIDSNLIVNPKKNIALGREALDKLAQKLILMESEKKVEAYFKKLIKDSVEAVLAVVFDVVHKFYGIYKG